MSMESLPITPQASDAVEQLRPQLAQLEIERQQLSARTKTFLIIVAVASLVMALLLRLILGGDLSNLAVLSLVVGVVVAVWQLLRRQKRWEQRVLDAAVPVICSSLGDINYQPTASVNEFLAPFEKLGVVGSSNRRKLQHLFRGQHLGTGFEFIDATLTRSTGGKNSSSTTVFQGLLYRIQLPYHVDQRLLISPRVGIKLLNKRADMSEVKLDDPAFDEKFVVHHDLDKPDGAALARRILTPELRSGLLELDRQESKKAFDMGAFVFGLMYDSLYVAQSRFQKSGAVGKVQIEKPMPFLDVRFFMLSDSRLEARVTVMVHDVATVYRIIDHLPLKV